MMEFLIIALATWRLSSLLVHEEGPFDIFIRLRHRVGVAYDEWSNVYGKNEVARALCCMWCTSVWVGIALAVLYYLFREPVVWVASPFALSAGAVIVERIVGSDE